MKETISFSKTKVGFVNLTAQAETIVKAFRSLKMHEQQQMESSKVEKSKIWKPLSNNWKNANVDATIDNQKQRVGLGVVIRNDEGEVVAAAIRPANFNGDVPFA